MQPDGCGASFFPLILLLSRPSSSFTESCSRSFYVLGGSCALDSTDERIPCKMDATQEAQSSANEGLESMQVEQVRPPEWRSVLNFNHDLGGL